MPEKNFGKNKIKSLIITLILGIFLLAGFFYFKNLNYSLPSSNNNQITDSAQKSDSTINNLSSTSPSANLPTTDVKPVTPKPKPPANQVKVPGVIMFDIPFTSQAPTGDWQDQRYQQGCEEASALMVMSWINKKAITQESAVKDLLAIAEYEQTNFGLHEDTAAPETVEWIFNGYFKYENVSVKDVASADDIIMELKNGNAVIVPVNGQIIGNPNYTQPGPLRHNIVIRGYNGILNQFITNDPGTRRGEKYYYDKNVLFNALQDYPTGRDLPITETKKTMIVITP